MTSNVVKAKFKGTREDKAINISKDTYDIWNTHCECGQKQYLQHGHGKLCTLQCHS